MRMNRKKNSYRAINLILYMFIQKEKNPNLLHLLANDSKYLNLEIEVMNLLFP